VSSSRLRTRAPGERLPLLLVVALAWLALADIPTLLRVGPLSVSGAATLLAGFGAIVLAPLLLLHGRGRSTPRTWRYSIAPGPRRGVVPVALLLFCGLAFIGLAQHSTQNAIQQLAVYFAFVAAIAVGALYSTPRTPEQFLRRTGAVMGVVGLVAIPVFAANVVLWTPRGFALAAMLAIAILVPHRSTNPLARLAPYLLTLAIAVSLSRTATAIAVLLLAFAILRSRYGMRGFRIALAFAALAVGAVVAFLTVPALRDRFTTGDNGVDVGGVALNTSGRSNLWELVIQDGQKDPWWGLGPGSASDVIIAKYPFVAQPHNEYLRLWHDFGYVGAALFVLGLLVLAVGALRRTVRAPREHRAIHWSAFLGITAVSAAALTDNPFVYPFVMVPLGVVVGMSIGRRELDRPAPAAPPVETPVSRPRRRSVEEPDPADREGADEVLV
jgi:O-antigen ligase